MMTPNKTVVALYVARVNKSLKKEQSTRESILQSTGIFKIFCVWFFLFICQAAPCVQLAMKSHKKY